MKLESYLTERKTFLDDLDYNVVDYIENNFAAQTIDQFGAWWKMLKKDCKPYLEVYKQEQTHLWRGMKNTNSEMGIKVARNDRKPVDMDVYIHTVMNDWFKKNFGWMPRSEGVFATSWIAFAGGYGKPMAIFPKGKFKYVYSTKAQDIYAAYFSFVNFGANLEDVIGKERIEKEWGIADPLERDRFVFYKQAWNYDDKYKPIVKEYTEKVLDMADYRNTGLDTAIQKGNEIMIGCEKYYWCDRDIAKLVDMMVLGKVVTK